MPRGVYERVKTKRPYHFHSKPDNVNLELKLREKFKDYIGPRDEYLDYNVRGEKARKLAGVAECIKALNGSEAFKLPIPDFEKAYGVGKAGISYVRAQFKKFGIKQPRVIASADYVHMWMPVDVKKNI